MFQNHRFVLIALTSAVLSACGGGGGGSDSSAANALEEAQRLARRLTSTLTGSTPTSTTSTTPTSTTLTFLTQPASVSVSIGGTATFSASTSAGASATYQWLRNGVAISGASGSSYTLTAVSAMDSGAQFSVTATSGGVSVTSSVAVLTVASQSATAFPVLFVTSVPVASFQSSLNAFSNHGTLPNDAVAGGDLFVRYPDGTLRNLTKEAGWGVASGGIQGGAKAISVRQPTMHWDGKKAIFSMLVGGAEGRYAQPTRFWQIYEVTGLGQGETVVITKVANQPSNYNNISPVYGTDDNILFISDAPLLGMTHTYPQRDEYESAGTNTGIWKLNVVTGKVTQIEHAPSGVFDLFVDSFGRVLFTKWDHLKRDQQADADRFTNGGYGTVDYETEMSTVVKRFPATNAAGKPLADSRGTLYELFPAALAAQDPTRDPNESLHDFNQFTIWQVNEDGSNEETINHVGRHEFGGAYQPPSFFNDPNLSDALPSFSANAVMRGTVRADSGFFQIREDVNRPGTYMATYAFEFARQSSGRVVEFTMPPAMNPETVVMKDYTNATLDQDPYGSAAPKASMTGHYRNPLRLSDGSIVVSHTPEYRLNGATTPYILQLKKLVPNPFGTDNIAGASLTGGIVKDIRWWTDDATPKQYVGPLNEHDAVEVRGRTRPATRLAPVADVEKKVLTDEGINEAELRAWLQSKNLALIVSRNLTARDRADVQQPYNLRVPGGVQTVPKSGTVYDISALQIFQGDLTRGYGNGSSPGRRVFAKPVHNNHVNTDIESWFPSDASAPGAVKIGKDGSSAAFVPAGRALSWQTVGPTGKPVVRERFWVSFSPGEIKTCAGCHGVNSQDQAGLGVPQNPPEALRELVRAWKLRK